MGDDDGIGGSMDRLPPSLKLLFLFAFSAMLFLLDSALALAFIACVSVAASMIFCRRGVAQWLRSWPLLLTIGVVGLWTAHAEGIQASLVVLARLGSLSLLATVVTATTTISQFVETVTGFARPLEPMGIGNARDVGLSIGLVIRFIPEVQKRYRLLAEAHQARGLRMRFTTVIGPLVIGTMQSADEIADAIDARNLRANPSVPVGGKRGK